MLKNYLVVAFRHLNKYRVFSFINIFGLALGLLCCALVLLYVSYEISYDQYHKNAHRLYRVIENMKINGVGEESASAPNKLGPTLMNDFPDRIEHTVRFFNMQVPQIAIEYGDKTFNEKQFFFVDSSVFKVFSWTLAEGDAEKALLEPNSLVMTQESALRYFGNESALGKIVRMEGKIDLKVTGVLNPVPNNSHFHFDLLSSFSTTRVIYPKGMPGYDNFYWNPSWTYVLLKNGVTKEDMEAAFPQFVKKYFKKKFVNLWLQPITDIHLHSNYDFEIEANSDVSHLYIFSVIAFLILVIAGVNFVNLSTARAGMRMKEVAMRKAVGASRSQLIQQFLGESLIISFLAAITALSLIEPILPFFCNIVGASLTFSFIDNASVITALVGITMCIGILAGIYPALFLSKFEPVRVLKGFGNLSYRSVFREVLVVVQFSVSILLIIGTLTANKQLGFMRKTHLGFDKDLIVMIPMQRTAVAHRFEEFRNALKRDARIEQVTAVEDVMGWKYQTGGYKTETMGDDEVLQLPRLIVEYDFTETFGIPMVAGRSFSRDFPTDAKKAVLVNEMAARFLGWHSAEGALNKKLNGNSEVIGVVKDFNFTSLRQGISPLVIEFSKRMPGMWPFVKYSAVKLSPQNIDGGLEVLRTTWKEFCGNAPLEFFFLDESLEKMYRAENALSQISSVLAGLTIIIASMGLFGLAAFMAERRTKEIGVRKVLGSSASGILFLLSRDFLRLIGISTLIAWPLAYYVTNYWLDGFAYRIETQPFLYIISAALAVAVALCTISFQALKAATANPVESLKYE